MIYYFQDVNFLKTMSVRLSRQCTVGTLRIVAACAISMTLETRARSVLFCTDF